MKWEYKTVKFDVAGWWAPNVDPHKLDAELNRLGAEGWELVSAFDTNWSHGASRDVVAIFKRAVAT